MGHIKIATFLCYLMLTAVVTFGQTKKLNNNLSYLIDSLKNADQSPLTIKNGDSAGKVFQKIIHSNFPAIKSIADTYGFPGYDLVGKESSQNYWMLVQHSDFDVPFQKRVLKLMKVQVDKKNASGQKYAYLIDRINLNEGKQQIYGTQVNMGGNGTTIKPCIDTTNLDKRRLAVGLTPIKDYLKKCDDAFYEMNKDRLKKPRNNDSTKKNGM
ncbi:MAG: DUF6624 domain-containing protein [Janthinobacterium lividum]